MITAALFTLGKKQALNSLYIKTRMIYIKHLQHERIPISHKFTLNNLTGH